MLANAVINIFQRLHFIMGKKHVKISAIDYYRGCGRSLRSVGTWGRVGEFCLVAEALGKGQWFKGPDMKAWRRAVTVKWRVGRAWWQWLKFEVEDVGTAGARVVFQGAELQREKNWGEWAGIRGSCLLLNLGVKSYFRGFWRLLEGKVLTGEEDGIKNELKSKMEDRKKNR